MASSLRPVRADQKDRHASPWPLQTQLRLALWRLVQALLFRPSPAPLHGWRAGLLRLFGARIQGRVTIQPSVRIWAPWNLRMEPRSCLGDRVEVYNLAPITIRRSATVAQECYLCTGTHDLESPALMLMVAPIEIGEEAFLGARTFVLPGRIIGRGGVTGACSVITRDVDPGRIVAGNPARPIGTRRLPSR
jgi:putative colanic acid biosynthesis acetyltransferase WcaF